MDCVSCVIFCGKCVILWFLNWQFILYLYIIEVVFETDIRRRLYGNIPVTRCSLTGQEENDMKKWLSTLLLVVLLA